jgi:hypothetical protein
MTEDKFEEFLRKSAQGYNAPPVRVPRDEMWAAIEAKRAVGPRVVYGGGATYVVGQRKFGTKMWLGAAAAAMLLVATGVGIGRWTAGPQSQQMTATLPLPPQVVAPSGTADQVGVAGTSGANSAVQQPGVISSGPNQRSGFDNRGGSGNRVATISSPDHGQARTGAPGQTVPNGQSAYQMAAVQHLSEAEALLTSFRALSVVNQQGADHQMDAQLGVWARQLLSNTRLLLDSPIANDPQRRPLLEDLELVLVQIVQLSPGSTPQDRELIEKTLQQDHVMTRLRTAIPAGAQRGS